MAGKVRSWELVEHLFDASVSPERLDELIAAEATYGLSTRRVLVSVFVVAAVVLSVFFFPISSGLPVPYWFWHIHMWSPTWI